MEKRSWIPFHYLLTDFKVLLDTILNPLLIENYESSFRNAKKALINGQNLILEHFSLKIKFYSNDAYRNPNFCEFLIELRKSEIFSRQFGNNLIL